MIGSGGGREAFALAKKGFDVTAIDVSEGLIRFSKEKAKKKNVKNVDFRCISMYEFKPEKNLITYFSRG